MYRRRVPLAVSMGGRSPVWVAAICALVVSLPCQAERLLNDAWTDGSRGGTNRLTETAVWVGREEDVTVAPGKLSTTMGSSSQKIWTYLGNDSPVSLGVGEQLSARVSFVLRGALYSTTSRSFRLGLFHDPTDPRVESDEQLSTWSQTGDGSTLGSGPICDKFDLLFLRISNNTESADQIDFTRFEVEKERESSSGVVSQQL